MTGGTMTVERLPSWVDDVVREGGWRLFSARVVDAAGLEDAAFEEEAAGAYAGVFADLDALPHLRPARIWNLIPELHRRCADGRDRYNMVFNAGRHTAFRRRFGRDFPP